MVETVAVLATGLSMSQAVADSAQSLRCIAVSDTYKLAPWAEAIVAQDLSWWHANPEAMKASVPRYSTSWFVGVSRIRGGDGISSGTNSGLAGLHVAIQRGAKRVLLLGFDMRGTHYFGPHVGLKNTSEARFVEFRNQFARYAQQLRGVEVLNCTPGSALNCFPIVDFVERAAA